MTNVEIAKAINSAVQNREPDKAASLVTEHYIQHTPLVADGREGLRAFVKKMKDGVLPAPKLNTVRILEDGDFVVLHHEAFWPQRRVMYEIFRMEDGLAAEHWSGIMDHPATTANGHSMIDGATEITDHANTHKNKALARSFVETVLINGQFDKILNFYHPGIIQHNPFIPDTVDGLIKGVQELQRNGLTIQIEKVRHVFGEGNFVLVVAEGKFAGKSTAFFDLFRIENGKVAEHWDVLQEIPEKQAHNNSMF
jgi:predicted SnoaL-like aldol condensation-catalyzing enzyme